MATRAWRSAEPGHITVSYNKQKDTEDLRHCKIMDLTLTVCGDEECGSTSVNIEYLYGFCIPVLHGPLNVFMYYIRL